MPSRTIYGDIRQKIDFRKKTKKEEKTDSKNKKKNIKNNKVDDVGARVREPSPAQPRRLGRDGLRWPLPRARVGLPEGREEAEEAAAAPRKEEERTKNGERKRMKEVLPLGSRRAASTRRGPRRSLPALREGSGGRAKRPAFVCLRDRGRQESRRAGPGGGGERGGGAGGRRGERDLRK